MIALYSLIIMLLFYKYLDSREKKKVTRRRKNRAKFLFTLLSFIHIERKHNYLAIIIKTPEFTIPKL